MLPKEAPLRRKPGTTLSRGKCHHVADVREYLLVEWCVACSGWRCTSWERSWAEPLDTPYTSADYTHHFFPAEDTGPDDVQALVLKMFRQAQEMEQDARNV